MTKVMEDWRWRGLAMKNEWHPFSHHHHHHHHHHRHHHHHHHHGGGRGWWMTNEGRPHKKGRITQPLARTHQSTSSSLSTSSLPSSSSTSSTSLSTSFSTSSSSFGPPPSCFMLQFSKSISLAWWNGGVKILIYWRRWISELGWHPLKLRHRDEIKLSEQIWSGGGNTRILIKQISIRLA